MTSTTLFWKNLLFTVCMPGTVAVYLPVWAVPHPAAAGLPWRVGGGVAIASGAVVLLWCVWDFARQGRGTPFPLDPPKELVARGLYRWSRNPMYVGVVAVVLGWTTVFRSPELLGYAVVVAAVFQAFVVWYEEPHLRRLFGPAYERYCAQVPRWFRRRSAR